MAQKRYSDSGSDQANKIIRRDESAADQSDIILGMQMLTETVGAMNRDHAITDGYADLINTVRSLSHAPPEPSMALDPDVLNMHQVFEIPEAGFINQQIEPGTSDTGFINNQNEPEVPEDNLNDHQVLDGAGENVDVQQVGEGSDDPHHNSEMADMGLTPNDVERLVRDMYYCHRVTMRGGTKRRVKRFRPTGLYRHRHFWVPRESPQSLKQGTAV
nr:uncharacterized protein LOC129438817 [Misgurnus anguillicaudatus]